MHTVNDFSEGQYIYDNVDAAVQPHELPAMLSDVANEWMHIGVLLGVSFDWLKQRRNAPPRQNLIAILRQWLNTTPEATLQHLVEAVEHKAGGGYPFKAAEIKTALETKMKGKTIVLYQ